MQVAARTNYTHVGKHWEHTAPVSRFERIPPLVASARDFTQSRNDIIPYQSEYLNQSESTAHQALDKNVRQVKIGSLGDVIRENFPDAKGIGQNVRQHRRRS